MFNLTDLDEVRQEMCSEIRDDIEANRLYISDRLNEEGCNAYPAKLLEAAHSTDIAGFMQSLGLQYFNTHYQRRKPSGGFTQAQMPVNANSMLCEGEFNRFYIRAVCRKAVDLGQRFVEVYRARPSSSPRLESVAIENEQFEASELLYDLRISIGTDTALGLPPGPNSGMSVKLIKNV